MIFKSVAQLLLWHSRKAPLIYWVMRSKIILRAQKSQKVKNIESRVTTQWNLAMDTTLVRKQKIVCSEAEEFLGFRFDSLLNERTANAADNLMSSPKIFLYVVFHIQTIWQIHYTKYSTLKWGSESITFALVTVRLDHMHLSFLQIKNSWILKSS